MAVDYELEINMNYAKAIANMKTFEDHLTTEGKLLRKLETALNSGENGVKKLVTQFKEQQKSLEGVDKSLLKFVKHMDSVEKAAAREAKALERKDAAMKRLANSYDKGVAAANKIAKATKDLSMLQEQGYISQEKQEEVLKRVTKENDLLANRVAILRKEFVKNDQVVANYGSKILKLIEAQQKGVITTENATYQIKKNHEAMEKGYVTAEAMRKAQLKQADAIHKLRMEQDQSYAVTVRYDKALDKLQKSIAFGAISTVEYERRLSTLNQQFKHNGQTAKEVTVAQQKLTKSNHELNMTFNSGYAAQVKYAEGLTKIQRAAAAGAIGSREYQNRYRILNEELARGGVTHKELRVQQLAVAKSNRDLKMSYSESFATIVKNKEVQKELASSLRHIKQEFKEGKIGATEYRSSLTLVTQAALKSGQTVKAMLADQASLVQARRDEAIALDKLKEKYIQSYGAAQKMKRSKEDLNKLFLSGTITIGQFKVALKELMETNKGFTSSLEKEARALRELQIIHDPLYAARQRFKQKEVELKTLLDNKVISQQRYNDILRKYQVQLAETLAVESKSVNAKKKEADSLNELRMKYDNVYAAQVHYKQAQADIEKLKKKTNITTERANELLKIQTQRFKEASGASVTFINRFKQMSASMVTFNGLAKLSAGYVKALHLAWKGFFTIMAVQTFGRWARDFAKTGENIELMARKLKILTGESRVLGMISESALRVGIDFEILNKSLTRFAITTKGAFETREMLNWTETLVKAGRASGSTTQELSSGLLQLSQAMSAGRLMGDEYRSISENMPFLKQSIEDVFAEMGMGSQSLKTLSTEGRITTEILIKSFEKLGTKMDSMGNIWDTIDASISRITIQWQLFVYQMNKGSSVFKDVVNSIADILGVLRESLFGKLDKETEKMILSGKIVESTLKNTSTSLVKIGEAADSTSSFFGSLTSVIFGSNEAVAEGVKKTNELSSSMSLFGTILATIIPLFAIGLIGKLGKFVLGVSGITTSFSILTKMVTGFRATFLMAAVAANKFFGVLALGGRALMALAGPYGILVGLLGYSVAAIINHVKELNRLKVVHEEFVPVIKSTNEQLELFGEAFDELDSIKTEDAMSDFGKEMVNNQAKIQALEERIKSLSNEISNSPENVIELRDEMLSLIKTMQELQNQSKSFAVKIQVGGQHLKEQARSFKEAREEAQKMLDGVYSNDSNSKLVKFSQKQAEIRRKFDDISASLVNANDEQKEWIQTMKTAALQKNARLFAEDNKENTSSKELKSLNKLTQARKEYNNLLKNGIGGSQLEESRAKLEKYNGVAEKLKQITDDTKKSIEAYNKEYETRTDTLNFELRHMKESNPLMAQYMLDINELRKERDLGTISQKEYNTALDRTRTILKESLEIEDQKKNDEEKKRLYELRLEYNSIFAAQEQYKQAGEDLKELYEQKMISSKGYQRALLEERKAYIAVKAEQGELEAVMENGAYRTSDDMGANLKDTFREVLDGNGDAFENFNERMLNSFKDMLAEMVYQALINPIILDVQTGMQGGIASITSSGGGGGGLLGTIGNAIGGLFGDGGAPAGTISGGAAVANMGTIGSGVSFASMIPKFGDGGAVTSPTLAWTGDKGPEAILPLKRGRDGKVGVVSKGGGGGDIIINITVEGVDGNEAAMRRSAGQVAHAAGNATSRAMKRNG